MAEAAEAETDEAAAHAKECGARLRQKGLRLGLRSRRLWLRRVRLRLRRLRPEHGLCRGSQTEETLSPRAWEMITIRARGSGIAQGSSPS